MVLTYFHMTHAGSERQKASGAAGDRLREASSINKSLSTLGHVIMSLVDMQRGTHRHVPYRDSRLTYLLQVLLSQDMFSSVIVVNNCRSLFPKGPVVVTITLWHIVSRTTASSS